MKEATDNIVVVPINFKLTPEKQHTLIWLINEHSPFCLSELADMIKVEEETLTAVLNHEEYLSKASAEKLVELFCVCCGC